MEIKSSAGRTNFSSKASNDSMFEDEDDFRGRDGMAADGFGACNHASAANSSFLPHLLWEWQDSSTNKHVTIRFILPSGCSETDITATIQPGGRSVVITYAWPDIMFQPSQLLAVYSSPSGELMYDEDSAKSVKLSCRIREMMETAGANSGTLKSTYEVALPFPCQEQFTTIKTIVAEHPGIEFVKHYHEEKKTWVQMLNLEMTGLLSSYQPGANAIPTRVFKKAAFKEPPTFRPVAGNPRPICPVSPTICVLFGWTFEKTRMPILILYLEVINLGNVHAPPLEMSIVMNSRSMVLRVLNTTTDQTMEMPVSFISMQLHISK
ncbi:hypothetical protein MHU86_21892 [Fragilaria crotonensis]|nr:hypothetical protein MHU86_21892 [Fragilaria crotonensis]